MTREQAHKLVAGIEERCRLLFSSVHDERIERFAYGSREGIGTLRELIDQAPPEAFFAEDDNPELDDAL